MRTLTLILVVATILQHAQLFAFSEPDSVHNGKYLFVVNLQKCFTDELAEDTFFIQINRLIEQTDTNRVIYIQSVLANVSLTFEGISVAFPEDLHTDERLKIVNKLQFNKNKPSAFSSVKLLDFIEQINADEFVVVGMLAGHSVLQTLTDGKKRGYAMFYIPDLILDKTPEDKNKTIALLKAAEINTINR